MENIKPEAALAHKFARLEDEIEQLKRRIEALENGNSNAVESKDLSSDNGD